MSKNHYILSKSADTDLEEIFEFTLDKFGFQQAEKYLLELENVFETLYKNPSLGKKRNEIKNGLLSFLKDNHVVFYRIVKNHIRIVRVLHSSRDIPNHF